MACNAVATVRVKVAVMPNLNILEALLKKADGRSWELKGQGNNAYLRGGGAYININFEDGELFIEQYVNDSKREARIKEAILAAQKLTLYQKLKASGKASNLKEVKGGLVFDLTVG